MSEPVETVRQVVHRMLDALEPSGIPYALGGALALAAWSEPRATADVDIIVWLPEQRWPEAIDVVRAAGVRLDPASALRLARDHGTFAGMAGPIRVDVFVPSVPFYETALRRRVRTSVLGRDTWVHSAEVLSVFKLLFFRPKDLLDVERMLAVQGARLDRAFVRAELVAIVGENDPRISKWDEIAARVPVA